MKWKRKARIKKRVVPPEKMSVYPFVASEPNPKPVIKIGDKPAICKDHIRDQCIDGEVVASTEFRAGEYVFPIVYVHPKRKIVGETKDARYIPEKGWAIYLDAVLRDKKGNPVKLADGREVDLSGWYLESSLKDAGLGMETIALGATVPSEAERERERNRPKRMRSGRSWSTLIPKEREKLIRKILEMSK